jgi:hypothetical protein
LVDHGILSFNAVLSMLCKTTFCEFDFLQAFAVRALEQLAADVQSREAELEAIDEEVEKNHATIGQLTNEYFAIRPGLGRGCNALLDLSARHFRCGHSFHVPCLGSESRICPHGRDGHMHTAQVKRGAILAARSADVAEELANAEDPLGALITALRGVHFAPGVEHGGEDACGALIALVEAGGDDVDFE